MAKHTQARNASPRNTPAAPMLVLGQSLQQALAAAPSTPALPTQVPGALATPSVTLAKAAPAPSTPVHPSQQTVTLGKPYNVRAGTQFDNVASWQATVAFLASKGGSCTVTELAAHLKEIRNHANFAGYCVRRGYLTPVQPVAATVANQPAA